MQQVIIAIHLMVVTALVILVLYQKSEGGALGMGGGSGVFTGRGQANALTRATGILATIFFITSIALTVLPAWERRSRGRRRLDQGASIQGDPVKSFQAEGEPRRKGPRARQGQHFRPAPARPAEAPAGRALEAPTAAPAAPKAAEPPKAGVRRPKPARTLRPRKLRSPSRRLEAPKPEAVAPASAARRRSAEARGPED